MLESEFRAMREDHREMAADIRIIRDTLSEAKGGWRVIMLVAGGAGVIGAFAGKWLAIVLNGAPK